MNPAFWLALTFYLLAAAWSWFKIRPFMNRSLEATEQLSAILKRLDPERLERLVAAAERLAARPAAGAVIPDPPRRVKVDVPGQADFHF